MAAKMYNSINQNNMLRLRTDEANERQPQLARVSKTKVRVYINHREEERESTEGEETVKRTVYIADFIELESASDDALEVAKQAVSEAILAYDSSSSVNEFTLQGVPMWLDKATRAGLKLRLEAERDQGIKTTTLWWNGIGYSLDVEAALVMLSQLELYASMSYDKTQHHLAVVKMLEDVDSVISYDFTDGYPTKLSF